MTCYNYITLTSLIKFNTFQFLLIVQIQKILINPRTGVPILRQKLTAQALKSLDNKDTPKSSSKSVISALSMLSIRPKDETPEEKLKRKKALKEFRHV